MKKHVLPLVLAFQLVISLAMTGFAATNQVTYDIGKISPVGYLLDDDTSRVDFSDSADPQRVRYGETVYFPLLNKGVATEDVRQLASRAMLLNLELERAQEFTDSAQQEFEQAERELLEAINAATRSGGQVYTAVAELLAAIENETPDGIAERQEKIKDLQNELDWQKIVLDSAVELDSGAQQRLQELIAESEQISEDSSALGKLISPVNQREKQREALETLTENTLDSAQDALGKAVDDLADPGVSTELLDEQLGDAKRQRDEIKTKIDEIQSQLTADAATEQNFDDVYTPYHEAREQYLTLVTQGGLDSGAGDYLSDPAPDPDDYLPEVIDYCDAVKALLSTYQGISSFDRKSAYDARSLATDLERLGYQTDRSVSDGTLFEQKNAWDETVGALSDERLASLTRDEAAKQVAALEQEQKALQNELVRLDEQIAALAGTLMENADDLTPQDLEDRMDEWLDQIDHLTEALSKAQEDAAYYAIEREQEQVKYDALVGQLALLTDPKAPNAVARVARFRTDYPFLRFSKSLQDANDIEALSSPALLDELAALYELFEAPHSNKGVDSDPVLLQALRPYQGYLSAKSAYEPLRQDNAELARSAGAAQLALRQADPQSEKYPYVYENKAVDGVKLKSKWEEGKNTVDKISLVKKRYQNDLGYTGELPSPYIYFIALTTKKRDTTSTGGVELYGTISMRKSSKSDSQNAFEYDDMKLEVNLELGFNHPEDANLVPIKPALFAPDDDFDQNDEETFDFEADSDSYYIANTESQKKLVLGMNTDYDETIGDLYADQTNNLLFWNGNGGGFHRSGYLYLAADEDSFLYRINDRGSLTPVGAEYDDYENCFVIRTRMLGRYVVSDVELALIDPDTPDQEEDVLIVVGPDDIEEEPAPKPSVPQKPAPGWSQGSRSDEDEAPVESSSTVEPTEPSLAPEVSSAVEELPTAAEKADISVALLIGASIAGALALTLIVFLIVAAKRKRPQK